MEKEKEKAENLIRVFGLKNSILLSKEIINELSDLPRIPYNERREGFWRNVKLILEEKL